MFYPLKEHHSTLESAGYRCVINQDTHLSQEYDILKAMHKRTILTDKLSPSNSVYFLHRVSTTLPSFPRDHPPIHNSINMPFHHRFASPSSPHCYILPRPSPTLSLPPSKSLHFRYHTRPLPMWFPRRIKAPLS